jgi:nitrate reductase gamma subunit
MVNSMLLMLAYLSVVVFLVAIAHRAWKIARLPLHVRWELYPVAHEKERAVYGGSYLEELDWWTKSRKVSLIGELKVMIPEILLLAGVREHNLKHWFRSFPFHFGLYLLAGLIVLLFAGGIATAAGANISADAGVMGKGLYHLTYVVGYAGLVLGLVGSVALLIRRSLDADYREYTKKADYFNLAFFVVTLAVALVAHALADPSFTGLRAYFAQLVTFDISAASTGGTSLTGLGAAEVVFGCLLLAYIPLTHMSHFFTKWFMYHDIRWSDEPSVVGGKIERQVKEALQYPVSWSAPHIRGDGKKTWAEVATSSGIEEGKV